jgi:hemolysin D
MTVRHERPNRKRLRGRGGLDPVAESPVVDLARWPPDAEPGQPSRARDSGAAIVSTPVARGDARASRDHRNPRASGRSVRSGYVEFHPGLVAIDEVPRSPIHSQVRLVIIALFGAALAWSFFGWFASYTSAPGKIQMAGGTKVVEAVAPGKVARIFARDGDIVQTGGVLVELDPADAMAARTIVDEKLTDVRAEILRLRTEIGAARADTIDPNAKIPWGDDAPAAVRAREDGVARADLAKLESQIATLISQKHAKEAERDKYAHNIEAQKSLVAVTQENLAMIESLVKSGYNSQAKYLDMKAQLEGQQVTQTSYEGSFENAKEAILTIESAMAKTREAFVTKATQTASDNDQTVVDLAQQLVRADQTLANMKLHSPTTGVVHAMAVTTIGQVVKPGQQLMQIVPSDAALEILAYVSNTDIGFIRKGDHATIKVTAFTYGTYGSIDGTVTEIANDLLAIQGKATLQSSSLDGDYRSSSTAQMTGNLQFPIIVRAARSTMAVEGGEIPLVPGMSVNVEILTENRRGIDYIVSPLLDLFSTAGHEHS